MRWRGFWRGGVRRAPKASRPVARRMDDAEDKDQIVVNLVDDDVTGLGNALFARIGDSPGSACVEMRQLGCGLFYARDNRLADTTVSSSMIFGDTGEIGSSGARPSEALHDLASRPFARIARAPAMTSSCV